MSEESQRLEGADLPLVKHPFVFSDLFSLFPPLSLALSQFTDFFSCSICTPSAALVTFLSCFWWAGMLQVCYRLNACVSQIHMLSLHSQGVDVRRSPLRGD